MKDLYNDERNESFMVKSNNEGPPILEAEVRNALKHMKTGKAPGPDNIMKEMISALDEFGTKMITDLLNEIYITGYIPEDMCKSVFIALPKKAGTIECEQHRTISLMSHVTKILLRIINLRIRKHIKPEIAEEQFGFVEGKGTTNAIFILRTLIERSIAINKDLYLCFIDYTKAFDRVRHEEMMKLLEKLQVDGRDLRIIKNIYWKQTAAMKVINEIGVFQEIKRGVRQGCVLSPDLFSLYSESIMRRIKKVKGVKIGGQNINNIRYADDTVLIAESQASLQTLLNMITQESTKRGLELNCSKTEVMVISRKAATPKCNIQINGKALKQVDKYVYLGTIITSDGRCSNEIRARIAKAKSTFNSMKKILTNTNLSITVRKRVLQSYIMPILLYGCETWTMSKQITKQLEAAEMWFWRRMQRIPWTAKKTNEEVLREVTEKRNLIRSIMRRQARFFGHVMRRQQLENLVTTGKMEGKRGRGRPRVKFLDRLTKWHGRRRPTEIIRDTQNRTLWRGMIADAFWHGT